MYTIIIGVILKSNFYGTGLSGLGITLSINFGMLFDNMPLGMIFGMGIVIAIGAGSSKKNDGNR